MKLQHMKNGFFTIKNILLTIGITLLASFIVMAVHIYQVTAPKSDGFVNSSLQLARIDFLGKLSEQEQKNIESFVKSLPGIKSTFMNTASNILVYTYQLDNPNVGQIVNDNKESVSEAILRKVSESGLFNNKVQAKRYNVQPTTAGSCPIDGKQLSMYRKIGAWMHAFID